MKVCSIIAVLPFLNIVQASCWVPGAAASPHSPRVPNGDEMSYLVYTTLAYGAHRTTLGEGVRKTRAGATLNASMADNNRDH